LTALIEDGLRAVIAGPPKAPERKRVVLPRVSRASDGLIPGVDMTRLSDHQEMEDRDYLERTKRFE
jgi:hypothetical protein